MNVSRYICVTTVPLIVVTTLFVVPNNVETPPIVYLYKRTSTSHVELALDKKCNVQAQLPASNTVAPGIPLSVANVATMPAAEAPNVILAVCCAAPDEIGLHSLYVGVPKALFVLVDKFM
jgi:hypothetical protein